MAVCEIMCIRAGSAHLDNALKYAAAPEKTDIDRDGSPKQGSAGLRYASGIGIVSPDTAMQDFRDTWGIYGKGASGRLAYHLIQSFDPADDITPDQAQEIGRQMAEQLFPGHQAVVGTHLDRDHIHNHIVINAVSSEDGSKTHVPKSFLSGQVRTLSDRLCREHGLRVIEHAPGRTACGRGSYRRTAQNDLEYALGMANGSIGMALSAVRRFGYEAERDEKGIRILPPGAKRWLRFRIEDLTPSVRAERFHGALRLKGPGGSLKASGASLTPFMAALLERTVTLGRQRTHRRAEITVEQYRAAPEALKALRYAVRTGLRSEEDRKLRLTRLAAETRQLKKRCRQIRESPGADTRIKSTELAQLKRRIDALEREADVLIKIQSGEGQAAKTKVTGGNRQSRQGLEKWQRGRSELPHVNSENGIEEAEERRKQKERSGTSRKERGGWER